MRGSSDIVVVGDWDGGWDCVGERDLKSVASLIFYIYIPYIPYILYLTIFPHYYYYYYYYLQSLRTHSSTPKSHSHCPISRS